MIARTNYLESTGTSTLSTCFLYAGKKLERNMLAEIKVWHVCLLPLLHLWLAMSYSMSNLHGSFKSLEWRFFSFLSREPTSFTISVYLNIAKPLRISSEIVSQLKTTTQAWLHSNYDMQKYNALTAVFSSIIRVLRIICVIIFVVAHKKIIFPIFVQ